MNLKIISQKYYQFFKKNNSLIERNIKTIHFRKIHHCNQLFFPFYFSLYKLCYISFSKQKNNSIRNICSIKEDIFLKNNQNLKVIEFDSSNFFINNFLN